MIIHNNQPIQFNTPVNLPCNCDDIEYKQLVNTNDVTHYQIEIDTCEDVIELIVNGNFIDTGLFGWVNSGEWSGGSTVATFATGTSTTLRQSSLTVDNYYKVEIEVISLTGEFASVDVSLGLNLIGTITAAGAYTFYGFVDDTNNYLEIKGRNGVGVIDNVSAKEMDLNIKTALCDADGNIVSTRYLPDFIVAEPFASANLNEIDGEQFNLTRNYLTVFFNWFEELLDNGCYQFKIIDNCLNSSAQIRIPNGEFTQPSFQNFGIDFPTLQPWEITDLNGGVGVITGGVLDYTGGAIIDGSTFKQEAILTAGLTYEYEIKVNSLFSPVTVSLVYGGTVAEFITLSGTYSGSVIAGGTNDLEIIIVNSGTVEIEYVRHKVTETELSYDFTGVELSYGSHECTLLVNACMDSDAFNFGFVNTGFSPTVRLHSKLVRARYPALRNVSVNSRGRVRNTFFDTVKTKTFTVDYQPEYIHDFLRLMGGFEHFYIERVEFVVEIDEEYLPVYDDFDNMGKVEFDVRVKEELTRSVACAPEGAGCVLPPNILLQENSSAILLEGAEFILITG
jgi:hypothetical protein